MSKIMHSEWSGRLDHWMRTLKDDFYKPLGEISWEAHRTMDQLSLEEAKKLEFTPVQTGYTWGEVYEYCWFKGAFKLPKEAKGERIVLNLKPDGESAIFVNDKAFGTYRADWVNEPYHFFMDNFLTRCAEGDEEYQIMMETYAGHDYPNAGGCATGPVMPGAFEIDPRNGYRKTLGQCTYGIWNEEAYQLFMDVKTLRMLFDNLDETSLRAAKIAKALEKFTIVVDFEQERAGRIASYREGREALRPALEAVNGSTMPEFYAVGNAHLDLAWLWPMAETYRKTERTFAAQLRLIEEYPEYKFIQSQPASYEMCRKYYPELFERILEAIKKGQWIADGAMWVEPDTNMASGEALVRQLVHGKRYYKDVLGVNSEMLWLPDTFGYTAALPQILKSCGVKYLVTQKIFWSYNEGDQFPYHYFTWEGMDGSKITSFLPTSYTYRTDPQEISRTWKNRSQMQDLDAFLLPFGYGDGGGGPTRDDIELAKRQEDLEGGAKVKMASPIEFFEDMDEQGGPANTYTGELYFSAHRGTYTTQAKVKQNNRRAELALREMEMWGSLALDRGNAYEIEKADALWKELLLHQFHDILPGSSIARVYVEAEKRVGAVIEEASNSAREEAAALVDADENAVTVMNSLSFERSAIVELPKAFAAGAKTLEGEVLEVEADGESVKVQIAVPSCGAVTIVPCAEEKKAEAAVCIEETEDGYIMQNAKIAAAINRKGEVTSFILKESGREFAAEAMNRFHLYKDVPRLFDAWDIDSNYIEQEVEGAKDICVEIVKATGLEAVLKVSGTISNSSYTQYIRLEKDSTRLSFDTEVDWKELHRLLKVAFPVDVYAENGINEIQFGYVTRPTHRSRLYDKDRFEVCNHRYSALCDGAHGAAVLNDCKYGISMNKNALELTLLRAGASPELRSDNRIHNFTYALTAWEGSFTDSDVVRQGYELNVPVLTVNGSTKSFSAAQVEKDNVILETVKPAEDKSNDLVLRLYESKKAAVKTKLHVNLDYKKAYICNMLEEIEEEIPVTDKTMELDFGAFEVKTIRLVR